MAEVALGRLVITRTIIRNYDWYCSAAVQNFNSVGGKKYTAKDVRG